MWKSIMISTFYLINIKRNFNLIMIKLNYSITHTRIGEYPDPKPRPKPKPIPGWLHIDPINTQLDLKSVAYNLSNYKFTKGMVVTYEDLIHPKPLDYEPSPKFK